MLLQKCYAVLRISILLRAENPHDAVLNELGCTQGMTEKGIDQLRADLAAVDADCAEQVRKTVHDHYHHFIQACQVQFQAHLASSTRPLAVSHNSCKLTLHVQMAAENTLYVMLSSRCVYR